MDRTEARVVLGRHLVLFRQRSYADLLALMGDDTVVEVVGESGAEYQIEIEVMWEDPRKRVNLRVFGAIDDGRLPGALSPMCDSFILTPDGQFVGE